MKTLKMIAAALLACTAATPSLAADGPELRVGAAKVDITPKSNPLPGQFTGVLDPLYIRAIVVEDGGTRAALVTVDAGAIGTDTWTYVTQRVAKELGIPAANVLLTATHTHSVPFGPNKDAGAQIVEAIASAAKTLRPGRFAYGSGVSYINVNRNIIDPKTRRWWEGPNYDGPSDKTVAVVAFEDLAGKPIAVYYNYGVHAVLTGTLDLISADIPGASSNYIEKSMGPDVVAVWSTGAAGDQNPIFFNQTYALRDIRIQDYAARGEDISNAMPPGGKGMDRTNPKVATLMEQQKQMTLSMGQMLGEEVLHVVRDGLERPQTRATIRGASTSIQCPGRNRTDSGRAGFPGVYTDGDPVSIKLSMVRIGDVMLGGVDGEVFTTIAQRFKRESPYKHTMMVTLTNGMARSGYIPNDAAFAQNTFEVVSSRLKPGCAEDKIVDGLLDLVAQTEK
ncbi:neutral/alkaline non-lysosomal ceramidase N-terminal domain-containing protein [Sphingomonas hengshuiensis]|uniref:Neutral ceramidase n=1 Tax=Sphingomonas hengshuiensis TaxID=1609977 RepID=A0A7U4LFG6_9SPHN|nr:neutral/alkaline non-lysosomal ceramidase N-terminal domain-containing protein [Sphingomonas hengshuiensis]AJP72504.1 hypothetical protein TS85_13035 [Sphingomonas hengshuiensis]